MATRRDFMIGAAAAALPRLIATGAGRSASPIGTRGRSSI